MHGNSLWEKLRGMQIRWPFLLIVLAAVVMLFIVVSNRLGAMREAADRRNLDNGIEVTVRGREQEEKQTRNNNMGHVEAIEIQAREQGMVKKDEVCFEISNPSMLDAYSADEMEILLQERAWGL